MLVEHNQLSIRAHRDPALVVQAQQTRHVAGEGGQDLRRFMARALKLAERGRGFVEPNPLVGCVLVRNGRLVAEGRHRRFGGPHAEVDALARCTASPAGATAYVTLEPCAHHGKTPPCCEALIAAGIRRVVVPLADPNPAVAGRGLRRLRRAGIRVDVGLSREPARQTIF